MVCSKTDLYELIFACDSRKVFGNVPMTQLVEYLQTVFNIELDKNISRSFSDMRIRNTQTPFLDSLKDALIERMENRRIKTGQMIKSISIYEIMDGSCHP